MKHTIEIDGERREIDIRAMDESFIVYRKMFAPPLTPDNIGTVNPGDPEYLAQHLADGRFKIIDAFFRKQVQIVGSCLVLAWDGAGVIGKMHFTTREMHEAIGGPEQWSSPSCYCVDHDGFAPKLQSITDKELSRLLTSASRTLRVLCFNIGHSDKRYHGQGIATAMLEYLKQWAREHHWRRIEVRSCPDITPTTIIGDWMLRRGLLERRGFHVLEETRVSPDEASRRLREIEGFLAGKDDYPKWAEPYAHSVHRLAAQSAWRSEYDKDYLMACDF
jgi:GNAT superfamily N-acetyltransferase